MGTLPVVWEAQMMIWSQDFFFMVWKQHLTKTEIKKKSTFSSQRRNWWKLRRWMQNVEPPSQTIYIITHWADWRKLDMERVQAHYVMMPSFCTTSPTTNGQLDKRMAPTTASNIQRFILSNWINENIPGLAKWKINVIFHQLLNKYLFRDQAKID